MKIVTAPDSYRESLSASEAAQAIERGLREIFPDTQYVSIPVAGGGEGAMGAMIAATQRAERCVWVTGPLGKKVSVSWGIPDDGKTAFVEMAATNRLELVSAEKHDPLVTTSRDTGELILQVLESGATNIIIGTSGNAISDGGAGMVQALGAKLCDANGNEIGFSDGSLNTLNDIDISGLDPRLKDCAIRVICNITNLLVGGDDASRIFGPQKGASEAMIVELDDNLSHYADVIKKALHADVKDVSGVGAVSGMGTALMALPGAELKSSTGIITAALNLGEHIHDCALVTTDEGRIDNQSIRGKVPIGVTNVAKEYHKSVIGIAGSLANDIDITHQYGIDAVFSVLTSIGALDEALCGVYDNIYRVSRNIATALTIGVRNAG